MARTLVDHRTAVQRGGIVAVGSGDGHDSRRGAARVETGVQVGRAGAAGRRDQAFHDAHRAAGCHFLPDDDDVGGAGIEAQTGELIAAVAAVREGADVAVGAEGGVDRAVAGAAHDGVRPQVNGRCGAGRYRAAACRKGAPGTADPDVWVDLHQGVDLLAGVARVDRHAGAVALSGGGGAGVGPRQALVAVSAVVVELEVLRPCAGYRGSGQSHGCDQSDGARKNQSSHDHLLSNLVGHPALNRLIGCVLFASVSTPRSPLEVALSSRLAANSLPAIGNFRTRANRGQTLGLTRPPGVQGSQPWPRSLLARLPTTNRWPLFWARTNPSGRTDTGV